LRTAKALVAHRRYIAEETIMILVKTEAGQQVFKDRSVPLSPRQRTAFILFDGKRSVDEVLAAGNGIAREEIDQMVDLGLLQPTGGGKAAAATAKAPEPATASGAAPAAAPESSAAAKTSEAAKPKPAEPATAAAGRSRQQRYKDAYPIATQLTGALGLMGFRLNLQVEGTTSYEDLVALAPKIRAAVGAEKAAALDKALND
jgi:pyruvate/2-oxoglutarate dehydrogenase complex dihydrolipoamide acyltransferase (E2) component